jgi:hypothetical protein
MTFSGGLFPPDGVSLKFPENDYGRGSSVIRKPGGF